MTPSFAVSTRPANIVDSLPQGSAPRRPALGLAASEPPRGRILLVEGRALVGLELQRALREAGWRVIGPATSAADVRKLIERGPIDSAVVDLDGVNESVADIPDVLDEAGVPFILLAANRDRIPVKHRARPAIGKPYVPSEVVATLERTIGKRDIAYTVAPAPVSWPRVFPQL